ncbi:MAG: FHA domain-containing protein [Candidatus Hydrogenedentota bacterium]|uniref:Response regulator of zinc sigma-54-dependent two-component system n=1 Tax=Sumerlaea chitinivorans TaxID=2250252 RepID=A0A2Z4Y0W1_SUMC1|nr:Response regulator of zinc sigma-54-dependent two-component system [Candidatus Sumerlaea chitinivorans]MCX7963288.1 sigma 54-interacting transcriptional regulator [Candidatus Sumerlaea chitinivorans]RMH29734.1 MAG: FHA domain-containing protein [Candidatus Hydrogenedentota bacterium]
MKDYLNPESQANGLAPGRLVVLKGPNLGMSYELGECTRIGRGEENEIQIPDPGVSRLHAEIVRSRLAYIIYDRGSRNGLIVNGQRVTQKVLLKNDEILVGNTLLAFNPDLVLENARFSNTSVVLYPTQEVTRELSMSPEVRETLSGRERDLVEFVTQIADIFASPPERTGEMALRLLTHLMRLFHADFGSIFVRDAYTKKLRPVVALPEGKLTPVNRTALASSFEEKRPTLISERNSQLSETLEKLWNRHSSENSDAFVPTGEACLTTMCAPVMHNNAVLAILVLEREQLDAYSLRDLALFHALAKMSAGVFHAAQLVDWLDQIPPDSSGHRIVPSRNPTVQKIFDEARRVAATDATVLITGESGTGKEILARAIHDASRRRSGPFIALNCAAIPSNLFESELFGYERGAFTGAARTTIGKIEAAHGGTLFLDEVGSLDLSLQPKLLRFLQEKAFYRVGGTRAIEADVRVIAATNTDLESAVREGRFREDLWYRLNVIRFVLPPLRHRAEDIAPLAEHFALECARRFGKKILGIDDQAIAILQRYTWPGNIRELANIIERAVILADHPILTASDFEHLAKKDHLPNLERAPSLAQQVSQARLRPLHEIEREYIHHVLNACGWNQAKAAEILGIHRNTLRAKIHEYALKREHGGATSI